MQKTWHEYSQNLRNEIYRLNMELTYWEAQGDVNKVRLIKKILGVVQRRLDSEKIPQE